MEQHNDMPGCGACSELERLFPGDSEMAGRMRAFDWSKTPLGPAGSWSAALRTAVRLMLANRLPMLLWWGPQYISIYNDPYRPVLGNKHPWGLGRPVSECWQEIWHVLKPLIDTPFHGGQATWDEDILLVINGYGFNEETHWLIAYSPVPDESVPGGIGGVLATVHETTEKVLGERRMAALRDLGSRPAEAKTAEAACVVAVNTLGAHAKDIPFALLYLTDADGKRARLAAATGVAPGQVISPQLIDLDAGTGGWPVSEAGRTMRPQVVTDLAARFRDVPPGPWPDPPTTAVVLPIASSKPREPAGFLVAGASGRLRLDDTCRGFLDLVATQVATAIANARAYEEEKRRAEQLAELDRAKTTFFSNVSHEFRTPLTLLLGPVEDMLARPEGAVPPEDRESLSLVHRSALRLLKLVNTLLDFSRIEAGRVRAVFEPTDLAALTAELASNFRSACEKAGLRLVVDCPPLSEPVYVDRDMWEKVVLNLVSNAFKFTFAGEITVRLRAAPSPLPLSPSEGESGRGEGAAELAVRDTGMGIPADELPRIFERFYRAEGSRGRTQEGTGIGLALVQELVKLHGGSVRVESTPGQGSTFVLLVPLGTAHLPADRIAAARTLGATAVGAGAFVEEALRWLLDEETSRSFPGSVGNAREAFPPAGPAPRSPGCTPGRDGDAAPRPRVLWADDNADMRDYVRRLLGPEYDVAAVPDGEAALAAARAGPPDLVLTDAMMPRLDGFGLLKELRADPRFATTPVILLSARAGEESRVEGLAAGADDYLVKPFSARELLARVGAHVALHRLRQEASRREQALLADAQAAKGRLEAEVAERKRAEAALRASEQRLAADLAALAGLHALSGQLRAAPDVASALGATLACALTLHGADRGTAQVYDPATGELRFAAQRGFDPVALAALPVITAAYPSPCAAALRTRARVVVDDFTSDPTFAAHRPAAAPLGYRAAHSTPLLTRAGELLGVFTTHYREPHRPTERELWLTDLLARQAADWIERARAEEGLRDAARRKDEFLAMLGHELRNPLAPLRGVMETLRGRKLDGEGQERAYAMMDRQVGHLVRLVDDLLDVSRITRGLVELRKEPVDLAEMAGRAAEMATPAVEGRGHDVSLALPRKPLRVEGDPIRLTQVIFNLLNNAAKYTDPGGKIRLSVEREDGQAVVRVRDNGSGMPPELVPQVFDLFTQGARTLDRAQGGLGLGLTLVKRLVEMHSGTVEARSKGPGQGSEFVVRLPALPAEAARRPPVQAPVPPPAAVQVGRALVVDDYPDVAEAMTWMLEGLACEIKTVHSGQAAVETAGQWRPDIVLCDLGMPGMDGYETCRRLRRLPGLERTVIAAVSGYSGEGERRKTQEAGFDRHLVKPVGRAVLEELVKSAAGV
jgi:signal transduction histidine kinase/DNA-binding response OmpR family regulator